MSIVVEFHYKDGDVGVWPAHQDAVETGLWEEVLRQSRPGHEPSHVVIREDNEEGQELSNRLYEAALVGRKRT